MYNDRQRKNEKVLLNLLLFLCFSSAESAPRVELKLKAVVDAQLDIVRIDNNGDINLFEAKESRYRVTSNENKNVTVTVETKNNWQAKKEDISEGKGIPYQAIFRSNDEDKELGIEQNSVKIDKNDFENNQYEFSLIF